MTSRQRLAVRGTFASAVATLLAAVSHTLGGGQAPSPGIVVGMAILLVLPAGLLLGERRPGDRDHARVARIAVTTVAAQAAFHAAFSALGSPHAAAVAVDGHSHHHGGPVALSAPGHDAGEPAWMLGAHVVAAIATIAILAYGESIVRRGWRWVRAVARTLVAAPIPPAFPRILARATARVRATAVASPATGVRGPPVHS